MHDQRQLDNNTMPFDVPAMWVSSFGHCGDDFSSNPTTIAGLVSSHVVDDRSKA
jgi:hypothetical protein